MESEPRRREEREGRREEVNGQQKSVDFFSFRAKRERKLDDELEAYAHAVIGAAIELNRILGPGLPESCYRIALSHELTLRGIPHLCEAPVSVSYKGLIVGNGKVDLLVGGRLVVELKVVDHLSDVHRAQVLAYLSALDLELGLLINFNVVVLTEGLKRIIRSKPS